MSYCKAARTTFAWALAAALGSAAFQDIIETPAQAEPAAVTESKTGPSQKPLLGSVSQTLPGEWAGVWQGSVSLKEDNLQGKIDNTRLGGNVDSEGGAAVHVNLQLETAKMGSQVFNLKVEQLEGGVATNQSGQETNRQTKQREAEPDIIFWHDPDQGHLLIRNGASIVIHGNNKSASQPDSNSPGAGRDGISYNNGGIVFGGQTEFHGQYFKADDQLAINDHTTVQTDRLDLDGTTRYTHQIPVQLRGSHDSGYLINSLRGVSLDSKFNREMENGPASPVELLGAKNKVLRKETVLVSPGVFDQKTVSELVGKNGVTEGYQQVLIRYTALSPQKMFVQCGITNFHSDWSLDKEFSASGYLQRH